LNLKVYTILNVLTSTRALVCDIEKLQNFEANLLLKRVNNAFFLNVPLTVIVECVN